MKTTILPLLAVCTALLFNTAVAADVAHGQKLQQQHCLSCHDNSMYTRKARKVTSLDGLHKQVRRCEQTLGLTWFDEDIDDVAAYLNRDFYHFKP